MHAMQKITSLHYCNFFSFSNHLMFVEISTNACAIFWNPINELGVKENYLITAQHSETLSLVMDACKLF